MSFSMDLKMSLFEDAASQTIGFNNKSNMRSFKFDPDQKPALIVSRNDSLAELENVPAIRRTQV